MHFNLEKLDKNFVQLEVTTSPEEIEEALAQSYKRVVNKINLPGFRKGHIPRQILEAQFGKEVLYEEGLEIIVSQGYSAGLKQFNLEPIEQPKLEVNEPFEAGKTFTFKIKIEVLPDVELGKYTGLKVEKTKPVVEEAQIEERLKALQERHAELVLSDKVQVEKGDFAVIDFEGYMGGKPFPGGAAQSYPLEIGSGSFIPGFEEQIIGMKVNDEKEVKVTFPSDYPNSELAGQEAIFKVSLKEIKVKEFPALDDEFAKSVGQFENLEQLKDDLKGKLVSVAEKDCEANFEQAVITQAVDNATVEVPETMVVQEMNDLLHRFEHNLTYQGLTLEKYLEYTKKTNDEVLEGFRPEAIKRVKTDLILNSIAQKEQIDVSEVELNEKIAELAAFYEQKNPDKLRHDLEKSGRLGDIKQAIRLEKTADYLKDKAIVIEK